MASRPAILAMLLGAALGVPYVVSKNLDTLDEGESSRAQNGGIDIPGLPKTAVRHSSTGTSSYSSHASSNGAPFYALADVLQMDIAIEWVYARWPRNSTGLSDVGLFGIRVPLVTGISVYDVAGSLTYYFNPQGRLQHITLRGRVGDASSVVQLVTSRFNLRPEPDAVPGEQLYQLRQNGHVKSQLRVRPESANTSTQTHARYVVELELERTGSPRYLERTAPVVPLPPVAGNPTPPISTSTQQEPVPIGPLGLLQQATDAWYGRSQTGESTEPAAARKDATDSDAGDDACDTAEPPIHNRMRWPS